MIIEDEDFKTGESTINTLPASGEIKVKQILMNYLNPEVILRDNKGNFEFFFVSSFQTNTESFFEWSVRSNMIFKFFQMLNAFLKAR